jgi:hypothetical protein
VEIAIRKLSRYKSLGTDQILAKLIEVGGETLCSKIHLCIHSVENKEKLPQQLKKSVIVPICKKGNKIVCNNYQGISVISTASKILFNILLARLIPHVSEIIGNHQTSRKPVTHLREKFFTTFCLNLVYLRS